MNLLLWITRSFFLKNWLARVPFLAEIKTATRADLARISVAQKIMVGLAVRAVASALLALPVACHVKLYYEPTELPTGVRHVRLPSSAGQAVPSEAAVARGLELIGAVEAAPARQGGGV